MSEELRQRLAELRECNNIGLQPLRDMGGEVPAELVLSQVVEAMVDVLFPADSEARLQIEIRVEERVAEYVIPAADQMVEHAKAAMAEQRRQSILAGVPQAVVPTGPRRPPDPRRLRSV